MPDDTPTIPVLSVGGANSATPPSFEPSPSSFLWARAVVTEEIGRPYEVVLDFLTPRSGVSPSAAIGQVCTVVYTWNDPAGSGGTATRHWSGLVTELTYVGQVLTNPDQPLWYRLKLSPPLALAALNRRSRALIAPEATPGAGTGTIAVTDALKTVLAGIGTQFYAGATGFYDMTNVKAVNYPGREFFIQMEETDLDFLSRLSETYGISYFWTADEGSGNMLFFSDGNNGFQPYPGSPANGSAGASVQANAGATGGGSGIFNVTMRFGQTPAASSTSAWDLPNSSSATDGALVTGNFVNASGTGGFAGYGYCPVAGTTWSTYDEPILRSGQAADPTWVNSMAAMRFAAEAGSAARLLVSSNMEGVFAGCALSLPAQQPPLPLPSNQANRFAVVSVRHEVRGTGASFIEPQSGEGGATLPYMNSFEAVPLSAAAPQGGGATPAPNFDYRPPRRTPVPVASGLCHAQVVSSQAGAAAGSAPDLDATGRYLVQTDFGMAYATGATPPSSTPPGLRVPMLTVFGLQAIGSSDARMPAGMHWPLRPGQAVLLGFQRGDPDRPYVAGLLPDAFQPSPVTQANPQQSLLRTHSGVTVRVTDSS